MKLKRHSRRRMAALLLVTVLMLATTSLSYTLWFEEVGIDGTVTTGTLDAAWLPLFSDCAEKFVDPDNPQVGIFGVVGTGEYLGKSVGNFSITPVVGDDQLMELTINGAYPYYTLDCAVKYTNTGSVPWHIQGLAAMATSSNLTGCVTIPASPTGNTNVILNCDQLYVQLIDGIDDQIHYGDVVASNLFVQLKQPAAENESYTFTAAICVGQWNEDPTVQECFNAAPAH